MDVEQFVAEREERWSSLEELLEVAEDSPAAGVDLAELGFPREATVVAVVRADRLVVPRGDTRLAVGDEVLALVTADAEEAVQQLLVGH